jgi:Transposase DDE domain
VSRSLEEEYLERVRAYRDTEPYRKALRKRAVWVEPLFAEAKEWHGLGRFRLRRLEKVNSEALMIAAGQNVKRLSWPSERKARGDRRRSPLSEGPKPAVPGSMESESIAGDALEAPA